MTTIVDQFSRNIKEPKQIQALSTQKQFFPKQSFYLLFLKYRCKHDIVSRNIIIHIKTQKTQNTVKTIVLSTQEQAPKQDFF